MNFLSHFYFERHLPQPERVIGVLLPDLLKNANKELTIHPVRFETSLLGHPKTAPMYEGWNRHVLTDKIFHNLPFFFEHTHELKILLKPVVEATPIRPSFLSHIALELLLDHLLLRDEHVQTNVFYDALEKVDQQALQRFLTTCGIDQPKFFFDYLQSFMRHRYVESYIHLDQVAFALTQICKRLWVFDRDLLDMNAFQEVLNRYSEVLRPVFMDVFHEIDLQFVRSSPY